MKLADAYMSGASHTNMMQTTIAAPISISGVGVHSGRHTTLKISPAAADTGILFYRSDIGHDDGYVLAHANNAIETQLCTTIENNAKTQVRMIEHLMAACHGLGIDNLLIELDSPEVPIFDGSCKNIVEIMNHAGIISLDSQRTYIEVLSPVRVALDDNTWAELVPSHGLELDIEIDFTDPGIGTQALSFDMSETSFTSEIAYARTFCMLSDVEKMRRAGLGKGGSLENAIVYDNGVLMNEGGLRMDNECVKHKALDCVGDLYLLGMPVKGKLISKRPGHRLSTLLVQKLLSDESAYRIISADDQALTGSVERQAMAMAASA